MMQNAPKRAKKCAKCAAVARVEKPAKVAPLALVVQKVAAVRKGRTLPRCSRSSTRTTTANSAKTNSWRWRKPSVNTCSGPAAREVRDPKVVGQVALTDTHDLRGADRQVRPWVHALKAAVAKIAILPVVQKVVAPSAAVSMAYLHVVVSIANASLVRAAVKSTANDLQVHHADAVSTANDSLACRIVHVLNVIVTRVAQNASATNATGLPVPRAAAVWIASASPVHPKIVASMGHVLHARRVLRSICG
jgi:hypothetical protein